MKTKFNYPQKSVLMVVVPLVCLSLSVKAQLLQNGEFESGTNSYPEFWYPNAWLNHGTVFKWENGTGIGGSKCISIENTESNDARWIQKMKLKGNTTYEFSGYIRGENIQNNQNNEIYANLSVLEIWDFGQVKKSTFGWTKVTYKFTTDQEGYYTLCARNGYYGNVTTGKCWFDNLTLKEIQKPHLDTIKGNQIIFYLRESDLNYITESNMTRWINHLDSAILKYEELIGHGPNTGYPLRVLSVDKYPGGWAVAGNPIKWYQRYIGKELKMVNDYDDWSFGILHEIGHNFDYSYWNFHGEHFANFKMFYVIQELNGGFWRDGNYIAGHDYKDYYKGIYNMVKQHYKSTGEIIHLYGDALTYKFIDIADSIGWEPFKKTFRYYIANPSVAQTGNINKYFHFLDMLSKHSGKDVRQYLTWDDRNEFVLYLGSMNYPNPPSDLKLKKQRCDTVILEWKDQSNNEKGFILEKRTENTWYSGEIRIDPGCTKYCDTELNNDSSYYYRIRSYNDYGRSDFSKELRIPKTAPPETPWFSHKHLSFYTGDTLHFKWTADTVKNDSVIWSFMLDKSDLTGDSLYYIKTSVDFSRQLKAEFEINNHMDSTRCFMALNLDLDPGNWDIDIDSIFLNKPLSPTIFQWIPMYDLPVPTWKMKLENTVSIFRKGFEIDVVISRQFCGYIKATIHGTDGSGNLGAKEIIHVNIVPEIFQPNLSHHYIEICEGEELPQIIAEGENIQWVSDEANPMYDFRDGQIYDVINIGNQTWMNENLNYFIPSESFFHNNDSINFYKYGRKYTWEVAENVCPNGWSLSTRSDWYELERNLDYMTEPSGFKVNPENQTPKLNYIHYWATYYYDVVHSIVPGWILVLADEPITGYDIDFHKPGADVSPYPGFYIRCVKDNSSPDYYGKRLPVHKLKPGVYKFYAAQSICGYEGPADTLIINVKQIPDPPLSANYEICENDDLPELEVPGNNIKWYSEPDLTYVLNRGKSYIPKKTNPDTTRFFVTQAIQNCESLPETLLLIVHPRPYFNLGRDTSITSDQQLIIGTEQSNCQYLWNDGSIGANLEIAAEETGVGEHTYWLTITNEFGCNFSDTITVNVIEATSAENPINRVFKIFPNPAHDFITIWLENEFDDKILIQLLDCAGNTIYLTETLFMPLNNSTGFNVSALPKGIYILRIRSKDFSASEKILLY